MGGGRIRMGGGHLGRLLRVGVRSEAKRMGRDHIRMGGGRLLNVEVRGEANEWAGIVFEWAVGVC